MKFILKRKLNYLFLILLISCLSSEQKNNNNEHQDLKKLILSAHSYDLKLLDELWNQLNSESKIPYTFNDSVYFLYRGNAESLVWNGDFNSWGNDKSLNNRGEKIG